jgi:hypothetical protein
MLAMAPSEAKVSPSKSKSAALALSAPETDAFSLNVAKKRRAPVITGQSQGFCGSRN